METLTGGLAIVEGRAKDQVARLELTDTFLLCSQAAQKTHIQNIAVFFYPLADIHAPGKLTTAVGGGRHLSFFLLTANRPRDLFAQITRL